MITEEKNPDRAREVPHHRMNSEERRRQLLAVAARVFGKKGFAGTTTKEIANKANVTEALIFKHFENKEQLYECVFTEIKQDETFYNYLEEFRDAMLNEDDERVFETAGKLILHKHRSNRDVYRMVMFSMLENRQAVLHVLKKQMQPITNELVDYIKARTNAGYFNCADPELYTIGLFGMIGQQGMLGELFRETGDIPDDYAALKIFTKILIDSMRPTSFHSQKKKDETQ